MQSLEANWDRFQMLNTVPVGISTDTVPSKNAWAKEIGIKNLRLLSDFWPHGAVAKLYGIFKEEEGTAQRANIILDEKKLVIFSKVYPTLQVPDIEEIISVLKDQPIAVK